MRKRLLWKIAIVAIMALVVFEIIMGYMIFFTLQSLNSKVQHNIQYLESIPAAKDGKDATIDQVNQSVSQYLTSNPVKNGIDGKSVTDTQVQNAVNNYMAQHPVASGTNGKDGDNGVDGTNGQDGSTPQIRCNTVANRWEVRYSTDQNWQLLNGQLVRCTIE